MSVLNGVSGQLHFSGDRASGKYGKKKKEGRKEERNWRKAAKT
jgi:hypothetical protein